MSAAAYDRLAREQRRPGTERRDGVLDVRELIRLSTLAASSHNTQPWKFRARGLSIAIEPDFSRRCPVVDPDDAHLFKSLGCAAENLVHAAAAQGHGAEVAFDPAEAAVRVRLERSPAVGASEFWRAITLRQCTKTAYDGHALAAEELRQLELAGQGHGVRAILLTQRRQFDAVAEFVSLGNQAQLGDRAFRRELIAWIRFNPGAAMRTGDGLAGRTGGQPPLPSWLGGRLLPLLLTPKSQADADAANIRSSGAIAVIVAARNDRAAWVEAGRAYERLALQAAALDLRSAFINQPIEVRPLRPQFESWLGLTEEHALLMVRVGHAALAPYSLRRPVDEVLTRE